MPRNNFSDEEKASILSQAKNFWQVSTDQMQPLFDMVNDCENMWRSKLPKELEAAYALQPDKAALAPGDIHTNITSLRSTYGHMLFGRKPYATLSENGRVNVRSERVKKAEIVLQSMLDAQHDGEGFESEADAIILQCLYAGVTCCFTEWHRHVDRVPLRHPETRHLELDDDGFPIFEDKEIASYAQTTAIDIRRSRIDPSVESLKKARIIGYQTTLSLFELIKMNRSPGHFYDFDEKVVEKSTFNTAEYYRAARGETERMEVRENEDFGDKTIEVWDIRGLFRFKDADGSYTVKDLVVHIGNQEILLGVKENDLPLFGWDLFDFPSIDKELNKKYPMGVVEPNMDTWIELMIKKNQSIDKANRDAYDTFIGDAAACDDLPDVIEHIDGQIIKVDTQAAQMSQAGHALSPVDRGAGGSDTFVQASSLKRDLQDQMGRNDYSLGNNPQRGETATAVTELTQGAQSAAVQVTKILKNTFLSPVFRKSLKLYNFFKGHLPDTVADATGQEHEIGAGDVDFVAMVEIDVRTALDRPEMKRRFIEAYPVIKDDPFFDPYIARENLVDVLQLMNPKEILVPDEHMRMIIERENMAMIGGIEQPVSDRDRHSRHIKGHTEAISWLQTPAGQAEGSPEGKIALIESHIEEHQEFLEIQNKGALGNTKEFGGAAGNESKPQASSTRRSSPTSIGLKKEVRA